MRNFKLSIFIFVIISFILSCCDTIDAPFIVGNNNQNTDSVVRKVLLEEFTGHRYPNCPAAQLIAKNLKAIYGKQLITFSIHSGNQSIPVGPLYTYDFRTIVGNELTTAFGGTSLSYPSGMINRKEFGSSKILDKDAWGTEINTLVAIPPDIDINLEVIYNSGAGTIDLQIDAKFLNTLSGTYNVAAYIIEDSIIKPQLFYNTATLANEDILNYVHMHVLRGAVNSTWGDTLVVDPAANATFTKTYNGFSLNSAWIPKNLAVVAFVYRRDNTDGNEYEVIQAEEIKVIE